MAEYFTLVTGQQIVLWIMTRGLYSITKFYMDGIWIYGIKSYPMNKKFLIKFGVCQNFENGISHRGTTFYTTKTHLYSTLQLNLSSNIPEFKVSDQLGYGHGRYLVYWDISAFAEEDERLFISSEQFFLAAKTSQVLLQF